MGGQPCAPVAVITSSMQPLPTFYGAQKFLASVHDAEA